MMKLFDIAYTVAYTEQLFSLFKTLVAVERKHGVELGITYHNSKACRLFIEHSRKHQRPVSSSENM